MQGYREYAASQTAWLGDLPSHWECKKIGSLFTERKTKVSDKDYSPLSVTKMGILPQLKHAAKSNDGDNRKLVCEGDFVINSRSDRKGSCGVSELDGSVSLINLILTPRGQWNNRYAHYLLRSQPFSEEYYRNGRGIVADLWTTRYSEMKSILLPVPPREEQDQIVRFLDWKVSSINRLINIKKNMIELLENRKKSIINSVLAGGASNSVCKESVIEGLLTIPTTWDERPLKFYASSNDESLSSKTPSNYEFNYIDISTTGFRKLKKEPVCTTFEEAPSRARRIVREGDTILSTVRTYLKAILYIDNTKDGNVVSTGFAVLRPKDGVYPPLLSYALSCDYFINAVIRNSIGVSYPAINEKKLLSLKLALPKSYDEQVKVYEQIMALTESTDITIKYLQDMVNGLQDLKNRLISDTVTGKIDVRGIDIPEYEFVDEDTDADNEDGDEEEIQEQED